MRYRRRVDLQMWPRGKSAYEEMKRLNTFDTSRLFNFPAWMASYLLLFSAKEESLLDKVSHNQGRLQEEMISSSFIPFADVGPCPSSGIFVASPMLINKILYA